MRASDNDIFVTCDAKDDEVEVEDAFNGTLTEEAESSDTQELTN